MADPHLKVTSHVGRDLLASASVFKTEAAVVWEYVVNSLQYIDRDVSPRVQVWVDQAKRMISISDNGSGMDGTTLGHFFTIHGENLERLRGRPGRGKFGTGKSAAFGIASALTVDTTRNGLRNVAFLNRDMINASDGGEVPVEWKIVNEKVDAPNGTTIIISDVVIRLLRIRPIIDYIERHLQAFRAISAQVAVNNHVCGYREPDIIKSYAFDPSAKQARTIGNVRLVVKVSRAPLPEVEQGIAITSGVGNMVANETCGIEAKEHGSQLFGEIDVPALETSDSPLAAYDPTRSLSLNPKHPVAVVLLGFIGAKLEAVRKEILDGAREAKRTEEARRLAEEGKRIADLLNEDFGKIRQRLQEIRSVSSHRGAAQAMFGASSSGSTLDTEFVRGSLYKGEVEKAPRNEGNGTDQGRDDPRVPAQARQHEGGKDRVDPAGGESDKMRKPKGGFDVQYEHLGESEERSRYDSGALRILINLDHPVVRAALSSSGVEDRAFRRLSYEIAFTEYAMGLGYEIMKQDPNIPPDDLLYEVRSSLNRIATAAAPLYK